MPQLSPAPPDLDDPVANAQRAAFIAVLAKMGREWGNHTTGILGFASAMWDGKNEYDVEIRREFGGIVRIHTQELRQINHELRYTAQILSGLPIPFISHPLDLHAMVEQALELSNTQWIGKHPQVQWDEPVPVVDCDESHWSVIFPALLRHGLRLARYDVLHIAVRQEGEDNALFIFRGNTYRKSFTDPAQWLMMDPKLGSTGIGLFVAHELACLYGGDVWVETASKTHFDYRLRLPIKQEENASHE